MRPDRVIWTYENIKDLEKCSCISKKNTKKMIEQFGQRQRT